jgi:hypothetical protein
MPVPLIAAIATPFAGAAANKLLGPKKATAAVPQDLQPLRQQQIQLLTWLTGGVPRPAHLGPSTVQPPQQLASGGPVMGPGGPMADQVPAMLSNGETVMNAGATQMMGPEMLALMNALGIQHMALGGPVQAGGSGLLRRGPYAGVVKQPEVTPTAPAEPWNPDQRMKVYFGNYGVPTNPLQNTAATSANRMLTQQSPEMRAFEASQSASGAIPFDNTQFLQGMLGQNPALAVQQLLQPQFEQSLAQANQTGGRFGSGNALMRGQAVGMNQATLAQLLGQGVNQQLTAAGQLGQQAQASRLSQLQGLGLMGQLAGQAGGADRANIGQAFGIGQQLAGQSDLETQRRLQLLLSLLGQTTSATLNQPTMLT